MDIHQEILVALAEIGPVEPWWSEEDQMFVFEHPSYPWVMHADPSLEETKYGYLRALRTFIQDRLNNTVADSTERTTRGRGGLRPGAGRPKGSTKEPTKMVRLPIDVADWIKADPAHLEKVRNMMG
jgi:hypothetical protein